MGKLFLKIKINYEKMSKQEKKLSDFLLSNAHTEMLNISELSKKSDVSEATIVRFAKHLGYVGYPDFKIALANENKTITSISLSDTDNYVDVYSKICDDIYSALVKTKDSICDEKLQLCCDLLERANDISLYGVGNSACVAGDISHKLLRLGFKVQVFSDSHMQMINSCNCSDKSLIIVISHSGTTRDVIDAASIAKSQQSKLIVVTSNEKSPLCKIADVFFIIRCSETNYRLLGLTSRYAILAIFDTIHEYMLLHNDKRKECVLKVEDETLQQRNNYRRKN